MKMIPLQNTGITDLRVVADIILDLSIELSKKINAQLLEPISDWIDDPDFMKRHSVILDDKIDWKAYKQKQRLWTRQQKLIAAERLKSYWREIRYKRDIRKEFGQILSDKKLVDENRHISIPVLNEDFISPILQPFNPEEQAGRETEYQFHIAENLSSSEILPWKIILQHQIKKRIKFDDLPQYLPDKTHDKTAKFINLLYLESEGYIKICQDEPFGQVSIQPNEIDAEPEGLFIIKDRGGSEYSLAWEDLSDAQRGKVIADRLKGRILCKAI
jgi:chromatin segregation and condensation protein Rec8/ScpA/Scc1 (kleisin family)